MNEGFLKCQRLAEKAAVDVGALIREGWTEKQTAAMLDTYLRDHGVQNYFHHPFVWFGDRTRFEGVKTPGGFAPTSRKIRNGDVFILDVAPILDGHVCDIGYTSSLGDNPQLEDAQEFLEELKSALPLLFESKIRGSEIWRIIDEKIKVRGYENLHRKYPFGVLGHRVHTAKDSAPMFKLFNFGWQSYWGFLSRGVFGELLDTRKDDRLDGLWAIEPHIGTPTFGAKFEEILVVEEGKAFWLEGDRSCLREKPSSSRARPAVSELAL